MASRKIQVEILGDAKSLERALGRAQSNVGGFGKRLGGLGKAAALGLAGVGVAAGAVGVKLVGMATDAAETQSKFEAIFGKAVPKLTGQIDSFAAATGASRFELKEQVADMGALLKPILGNTKAAAGMSMEFTRLATDLGSFNNVPTADALLAIRSGLTGEAEPLKRFGVLLNEAAVKAEGLRLGLVKEGETMTEQQKVQARASLIMQQTALAQGDAERTAGSMSNQIKKLKNSVRDAGTEIGMKLLPAALKVVTAFNEHWPTIEKIADRVFAALSTGVAAVAGFLQTHWDSIKAAALATFSALSTAVAAVVGFFRKHWGSISEAVRVAVEFIRTSIASLVAYWESDVAPAVANVVAAIRAVWERFGGDIIAYLTLVFQTVATILKNAVTIVKGVIDGVLALIRGDWSAAWAAAKTVVGAAFDSIKTLLGAQVAVLKTVAGRIGRAVKNGFLAALEGLAGAVKSLFRGALNSVILLWNQLKIPGFTIPGPGPVPDVTIPGVDIPNIPTLATGGIVKARPGGTLALLAERGRDEAVVPLRRGMTRLAALAGAGGRVGEIVVPVTVMLDGDVIHRSVRRAERRHERRNGG